MSNRLNAIKNLIAPESVGVADIGTDHAYLPILLFESGFAGRIIATDINSDPLEKAMNNIKAAGIPEDRIIFKQADGLDSLDLSQIDTVVISGMGSDLICSILDRCDDILSERFSLILQPMSKAEVLRYWLVNNGFKIVSDIQIAENGRLFQIIRAVFTGNNSNIATYELYSGIYSLAEDKELYTKNLARRKKIIEDIISDLTMAGEFKNPEKQYYENVRKDFCNFPEKVD